MSNRKIILDTKAQPSSARITFHWIVHSVVHDYEGWAKDS
jgi:hypothetical protein